MISAYYICLLFYVQCGEFPNMREYGTSVCDQPEQTNKQNGQSCIQSLLDLKCDFNLSFNDIELNQYLLFTDSSVFFKSATI